LAAGLAGGAPPSAAQAPVPDPGPPAVALIIDDLGNQLSSGLEAVALPGSINYSFLPHTPFAQRLAGAARAAGGEVLLHLPMESDGGKLLGPGGLTAGLSREQFATTIAEDLASVPYVRGVNNHMGSLLTRHPEPMHWLMQALKANHAGYFIDSRTTPDSVAEHAARAAGLPTLSRDVFLDHDVNPESIEAQFDRLLSLARERGTAIGIGHPYPETLEILARRLPELERRGIRLVHLSDLIEIDRRYQAWLLSSSPSPKAAKNLKPSPSSTCCAEQASTL
jgi:polysaccharide deacetylase 2 family uncharacterized protein YibQ